MSRLYFGNYKDEALDASISSIRISIVNIFIKLRTTLTRWRKALSIMLCKSPCKTHISKLRAVFLLEADFNDLYKIMFNHRILPCLEQHNIIPIEIVDGRKCQDVIHVVVNKKLIEDIYNQVKAPY